MKKIALYALVFVLGISGCGGVKYVDNADSREYSSMGIDYHDIESAAQKNVQSLLESG